MKSLLCWTLTATSQVSPMAYMADATEALGPLWKPHNRRRGFTPRINSMYIIQCCLPWKGGHYVQVNVWHASTWLDWISPFQQKAGFYPEDQFNVIQCCRCKRADIMFKSTLQHSSTWPYWIHNANTNFERKFSYWSKACCKIQLESSVTRSLFQFSRQEQELHSFNLVLRDEKDIFFVQSQASRREREILFSI